MPSRFAVSALCSRGDGVVDDDCVGDGEVKAGEEVDDGVDIHISKVRRRTVE